MMLRFRRTAWWSMCNTSRKQRLVSATPDIRGGCDRELPCNIYAGVRHLYSGLR